MKKIIVTEAQLSKVLSEAYPEKLIRSLINKFYQDGKGGYRKLPEGEIKHYIDRFQEIKNSPYVEEKDITKYAWDELKDVVDKNSSRKPEQMRRHQQTLRKLELQRLKDVIDHDYNGYLEKITPPDIDLDDPNPQLPRSTTEGPMWDLRVLEYYTRDLRKLLELYYAPTYQTKEDDKAYQGQGNLNVDLSSAANALRDQGIEE